MTMNSYERMLVTKWQKTMTRHEAENRLFDLRKERNGDMFQLLTPEGDKNIAPYIKSKRCTRIQEAANRRAFRKPLDIEHPILRKYIPYEYGTSLEYLSRSQNLAMRCEIAEVYDIPMWILNISDFVKNEILIEEFKRRIYIPNKDAYDALTKPKTCLTGLKIIVGDDIYNLLHDPHKIVEYVISTQRAVL